MAKKLDDKFKDLDKRDAVRDYVREHQGASRQEVMKAVGVSRGFIRSMMDTGAFGNVKKSNNYSYPCTSCGKIIRNGVYCPECLSKLRAKTKMQAEHTFAKRRQQETMEAMRRTEAEKISQQPFNQPQPAVSVVTTAPAEDTAAVMTIAVIDGNDLNLNIAKIILEQGLPECNLVLANSMLNAMRILHGKAINLCLIDDDITENYDGLEILKRIREDARIREMPVMMMTNQAKKESISYALSKGALDYIQKPFDPQDVIERIRKNLNLKTVAEYEARTATKILLVEDDEDDREKEKKILQNKFPCEIITAESGVEGMQILGEQNVDLVITNYDLPFMDGMKFLQFIRGNDKSRHVSVIMMTNTDDYEILAGIKASSARGYIRKPDFTKEGLELIERAINKNK